MVWKDKLIETRAELWYIQGSQDHLALLGEERAKELQKKVCFILQNLSYMFIVQLFGTAMLSPNSKKKNHALFDCRL